MKPIIPSPCTQKWSSMKPVDRGRHCGTCNTLVVDFSDWETKDIIAFVQQAPGAVCGRIPKEIKTASSNGQTNMLTKTRRNMYLWMLAIGLPFFTPKVLSAQASNGPLPSDKITIWGIVRYNGKLEKNVGFLTHNYSKDTIQVVNGHFSLTILAKNRKEPLLVRSHFIGFLDTETKVIGFDRPIAIELEDADMGEIIIKRPLKFRIKQFFNRFRVLDN